MYAKVFTSIYQGTLRGNASGILVFTNLLAHCDRHGIVDIHPRAIADEVGVPLEKVREALLFLESPDAESRTPDEDGRRIVRVDAHRDWGWRVVNYAKYRAIRNEDDRAEQNRAAQARWREANKVSRSKPASAATIDASAESAHAEAEAYAEEEKHISKAAPSHPRKRGSAGGEGFALFWAAYPKKSAKQDALKAFVKLAPSTELLDTLLSAIALQKASAGWAKDGGAFIPLPASWLRGRRWEDEGPGETAAAVLVDIGAAAVDQTQAYLAAQAQHAAGARSPEAQAARLAAVARLKGGTA